MSEATKTVLLIIPLIAMSVFCGYRIGDKRGRAEQKKLDEAECAAHPVVKEVYTFAPAPIVPQCRVGEYFQYNAKVDTFTCTPAPKPSKPAIGQQEWDKTFREMNDNLDKIGARFGLCWAKSERKWVECAAQPSKGKRKPPQGAFSNSDGQHIAPVQPFVPEVKPADLPRR